MMTIKEMKSVLAKKLKEEGTYFTEEHIVIKKKDDVFELYIKEYEHIVFTIKLEEPDDPWEQYVVWVFSEDMKYENDFIWVESNKDYDIESALIELGYYIGTRF